MAFLEENYILLVSCFVIVVLVILILKKSIIIVPQSYAVIIERFGKYRKTLHSGINFIFPFMDKPKTAVFQLRSQSVETNKHMTLRRGLIDIREQMLDYEKQKVITKDNVTLAVDPILYFQVTSGWRMLSISIPTKWHRNGLETGTLWNPSCRLRVIVKNSERNACAMEIALFLKQFFHPMAKWISFVALMKRDILYASFSFLRLILLSMLHALPIA